MQLIVTIPIVLCNATRSPILDDRDDVRFQTHGALQALIRQLNAKELTQPVSKRLPFRNLEIRRQIKGGTS